MSTILVVDDEPDIRFTVRIALELAGHEIIEADDGTSAMQRAHDKPDGIILDLRLGDVDGLDVLTELKAEPALASIPVLCLSAHSDTRTRDRAIELGASGYVNKPFELAVLREAVQTMVDSD